MNIEDTDSEDDMRSEDEEDDDDLSDEEKETADNEDDIKDWEELRNIQFWFLDIVFRCLDLRGVSAHKNILTTHTIDHLFANLLSVVSKEENINDWGWGGVT